MYGRKRRLSDYLVGSLVGSLSQGEAERNQPAADNNQQEAAEPAPAQAAVESAPVKKQKNNPTPKP